MKKQIFIPILIFVIVLSCSNQIQNESLIIPANGVGKYKLETLLTDDYDKNKIEITLDEESGKITDIFVKSIGFKTKEGFGVGSNLDNIIDKYGQPLSKKMTLSKGALSIGGMEGLFYNGVAFLDNDKNAIVDGVWVFKAKSP